MSSKGDESVRVLEALLTGIEIESKGLKFYTNALKKVTDPKGKQTLKYLGDEEKDHLKFMTDLKNSFQKKGAGVKNILEKKIQAKSKPKIFPKLGEFLEEVAEYRGDEKILEEAAEIEERSIQFYRDSAIGLKDEKNREIFNILIREEEGHLKLIEQMKDYMVLHGVWSGLEEYFLNE
jgi:rubrerythrin